MQEHQEEYMASLRQAIAEIEEFPQDVEPPAPTSEKIIEFPEAPAPNVKSRGRPRIHPVSTEPKKAVGRPRIRTVDEQKQYRREYLRKYKQMHKKTHKRTESIVPLQPIN
jgi:hypothetical protein